MSTIETTAIHDDATTMLGDLQEFRRDLHRHPELGLQLPRTQERVLAALEGLPLEVTTGTSTTSVTAVLRGGASDGAAAPDGGRPGVLLRADMDALPLQEALDLPYRSQIDGAMHACGHDLHTAMLVGAARLLSARRESLPGDVVFMFQPGEEGFAGARHMIDEGVLEAAGRRVDAAYGIHVFANLDGHGVFSTKPGPMLAACDELCVTVRGRGGHGSRPHDAQDPIVAAAEMVTALQTAVTRSFSAFDPTVVTVGLLQGGTKSNIIPDEARFEATVRTFSERHRALASEVLPRVVHGIAAAHGVEADVRWEPGYPVTVNHDDETTFVAGVVEEMYAGRHVRWTEPLAGAEDFSYVLQQVPGIFIGLGAAERGADVGKLDGNHSPRAHFDDAVLADGAALMAELAVRRLGAAR